MRGWLTKKGRRRFFVLQHSKLLYYASEDTKLAANGFIDLLAIESVESVDSPPWSFRVAVEGGRVYDLSADCETDRQAWLDLLAHVERGGGEGATAVPRGPRAAPVPPIGAVGGSPGPPPPRPLSPRGSPRGAAPATPRRELRDALEGERICSETQYVVVLSGSESVVARGTLVVSNYRVAFVPDLNCADKRVISLPFGRVRAMQEKTLLDKLRGSLGEFSLLTMVASDGQVVSFGFSKKSANNSLAQFLASYQAVCPDSERACFAFARFAAEPSSSSEGWDMHDTQREFERAGWPASFRLTTANACYKICESYPSSWVVPARVTDEDLVASAGFRSHGRVIACVWYDRESRAPLARCSQPAVGIANNRSLADERIIQCLLESAGTGDCQELQLFDARPKKNALANKAAKGAGYENVAHLKYCTLTFLNIENVHVVRSSWTALLRSCVDGTDDSAFYSNSVSWLTHVGVLLQGAVRIAQALARGTPCLVHCSDGWDRTPQLCCLVMLLNDAHHRTMRGFASMVESQWVAFGHQFALRHGWFSRGESGETAPIFLLFVDCVFQILDQFSDAFEFTEDFLMALLEGVDSLSFGTFLGHEKLQCDADFKSKTLSIWPSLFANPKHLNRGYAAVKERLEPSTTQRAIKLWRKFFLRYSSEGGGAK
jgi:myotubularin-related protein 1/2